MRRVEGLDVESESILTVNEATRQVCACIIEWRRLFGFPLLGILDLLSQPFVDFSQARGQSFVFQGK